LVFSTELLLEGLLRGDVLGNEHVADGLPERVATKRDGYLRREALAVLANARKLAFELARAQGHLQRVVGASRGHVFRRVEHLSVASADGFFGSVPVRPLGALVPGEDVALKVHRD